MLTIFIVHAKIKNMKVLIVVNPVAGKAKINRNIIKIRDNIAQKDDVDVIIKYTKINQNATEIIKNCDIDFDVLFVCGGDGTLNEAMQAICELNKNVPIAYLPVGTTNDFAKSLEVPFDIHQLSKNFDLTTIKKVDIGRINNRFFNYVSSTGLFAKTSYNTSSRMKNKYGRFAYVISGVKEVFTCKPQKLKVHINDEIIDDDFIYTSISNSCYIGGFKLFRKKDAKLDDGKFEVLLVKGKGKLFETLGLLIKIVTGNFKDKNIMFYKADSLKIESDNDVEWSIDGEYGGKTKLVNIENINKFAQYIMSKNKEIN